MKSSVEKLSATRTKLTVEVPFEELKPEFDKAYASLAQQVNMPGFRKGKVPARILEARLGRGVVLDQVINEMLPSRYSQAVDEHELKVLGQPEIDIAELEDGKHVTFTAEVDVRPEIDVPNFSDIAVEVSPLTADEDAVEAELKNLQARFGTLKPVERPAQKGDFVSIDLSATVDGEAIEEAATEGLSHEIGNDALVEGLDEALEGMSEGEEKTFESKLVAGEHANEPAEVTVKLNSVKERELPELDDDFAELASEFDTLAELRESLAGQVEERQRNTQAGEIRDKVLAAALEKTEVPLPESVVKEQVEGQIQQLIQQFGGDEKVFETMLAEQNMSRADFEESSREGAEESIRTQLFLDALADIEQPNVSQDELMDHIAFTASQYGMDPNQFIMQLQQAGQLGSLFADVRRGKALALNIAKVSVKDTDGNEIDPKQFFGVEDAAEGEEAIEDAGSTAPVSEESAEASTESGSEEPTESAEAAEVAAPADSGEVAAPAEAGKSGKSGKKNKSDSKGKDGAKKDKAKDKDKKSKKDKKDKKDKK
ncbi:trigger factor [Corynebacterium heidelbergense]|uniref:Trigger factor n=1 Tax=Corynebacterium heidelbergense TaxID=2055947 RepID=A0A364VDD8_9CORY|nr:trigger factor [Corynebacterium heidelbergense]RAV34641.1 trigger factor [Corynebacterium heidelbergense]WCZ36204.1 Trigger factor [Corynebacterium heidelbergense]